MWIIRYVKVELTATTNIHVFLDRSLIDCDITTAISTKVIAYNNHIYIQCNNPSATIMDAWNIHVCNGVHNENKSKLVYILRFVSVTRIFLRSNQLTLRNLVTNLLSGEASPKIWSCYANFSVFTVRPTILVLCKIHASRVLN